MIMKLKKIFAAVLAALILCSCGTGVKSPGNYESGSAKNPDDRGGEIKSSIFGRNVRFDGYTPLENLSLPVSEKDISETEQIGSVIYILAPGAVYYLNAETAESGKLFDTEATVLSSDGDNIYTYDPETGSVLVYSGSGEILSESDIKIKTEDITPREMYITKNYFDFVCVDGSGGIKTLKHLVYRRDTLEFCREISEGNSYSAASAYRAFGRYKDDLILKLESKSSDERFADIIGLDLENGKEKKLASAEIGARSSLGYELDLSYSEKTDTVLIFAAPSSKITPLEDFTPFLAEYSLSDPDNLLLKRYYLENSSCDRVFLSSYENAASIICAPGGYFSYDFLSPPESIVLACSTAGSYSDIIKKFESETGITVKTVSYGFDWDRLDIKLMAGDTDFDIYEPAAMHQTKYFIAGMFEDLSGYEGLKSRLDGNASAGFSSGLDGKYIGVPTYVSDFTSPESFEALPEGSPVEYSRTVSEYLYLTKNVDLVNKKFDDPAGDALYKLLRFLYDNPQGNRDKMPFGDGLRLISSGFLVMNPSGSNKENSAKFLEYVFDFSSESSKYESFESLDGAYIYWRCFSPDYTGPILEACSEVMRSDGKSKTVRDIAKKAASEVRMRIYG